MSKAKILRQKLKKLFFLLFAVKQSEHFEASSKEINAINDPTSMRHKSFFVFCFIAKILMENKRTLRLTHCCY